MMPFTAAKLGAVQGSVIVRLFTMPSRAATRLREPSIMTREMLEAAKTAGAVALEILNAEVRWLASTRATTVIGLKLKA
jgi:hypothetical protein